MNGQCPNPMICNVAEMASANEETNQFFFIILFLIVFAR